MDEKTEIEGRGSPIDLALVRELAKLLGESDLTEIEFGRDGEHVRVVRELETVSVPAVFHANSPQTVQTEGAVKFDPAKRTGLVSSPMVGTVYMAPQPRARPYVELGANVRAGQTILIIEAMKTMNEIPAPHSGIVKEILIENGQPVEFGEPLMIVE